MMAANPNEGFRVGEVIKPIIDAKMASELINQLYGLKVKSIKEMDSYDDRNFHITVETEYDNKNISNLCVDGYTFKVTNKIDSKETNFIDDMNSVLFYCRTKNLDVPIPVKDKSGETWSLQLLADEKDGFNSYAVRLLTYLPGTVIYHVPYTAQVLYQWGQLLARFHQSLKDFSKDTINERTSWWSLYKVPEILKFLFAIDNEDRRHLVTEIVNTFRDQVLTSAEDLPKGIIHGDFNEHNILVRQNNQKTEVYGILDLGDIHVAPIVFDFAVMLTYTMIECNTMDPLEASGHAIAGYFDILSLSEAEYQILKICICARLCQSLVLGAYTNSLDPSNTYVLSTSRTGWTVLQKLWKTSQQNLYKMWQNTVDSYTDIS